LHNDEPLAVLVRDIITNRVKHL